MPRLGPGMDLQKSSESVTPKRNQLDPVYVHSRREAVVILAAFSCFLVWVLGVSWLLGYREQPFQPVSLILSLPAWVFWAVLVPWIAADLFILWFCFFYMEDDDLGESSGQGDEPTAPGLPGERP